MLHGKGDQLWMTNDYEDERKKALEDRTKYTDTELAELEATGIACGGGATNDDTYIVEQSPYPTNTSIRQKKDIDIRDVDPSIGGK